jgi:RNA polymerase sigma-70 factor (ECF subfamily)
LAASDPSPDTVVQARACATLVRELLDSLPTAQAEALALHAMLGFTVAEVAESTGVPAETVRSRLRLAKRALRDRIEGNPRLVVLKEEAG